VCSDWYFICNLAQGNDVFLRYPYQPVTANQPRFRGAVAPGKACQLEPVGHFISQFFDGDAGAHGGDPIRMRQERLFESSAEFTRLFHWDTPFICQVRSFQSLNCFANRG